jgi:hypothetical protein
MRYLGRFFIVALSIFIFSYFLHPVFAKEAKNAAEGTLQLSPAYVEVTLDKPDETKQIQIFLTNNTSHQITLQMSPIDFKQKEPEGITTFIGQDESYSYSLASFLSFESDTLVLEPGEKKPFTVQITNRKDVSPGGHYAAVVAKLATDAHTGGATYLAPGVSSLIYLRKTGGERYSASLKNVSWPSTDVVFDYQTYAQLLFQNEGNVHIIPYGLVEITDSLHRVLYKGIVNTSSARILPESRRQIDVNLKKLEWSFPISFNTVTVSGHDSLNKLHYSYNRKFIYINPLTSVFIAAVILLIWRVRKRKK